MIHPDRSRDCVAVIRDNRTGKRRSYLGDTRRRSAGKRGVTGKNGLCIGLLLLISLVFLAQLVTANQCLGYAV
ncbi:hypothetical protein ACM41_26410 [Bradyrhizobium sp. CCBAU 21362]|nr:hypothetical protein [Bradyrhizobium sp. CCBAU 21362]